MRMRLRVLGLMRWKYSPLPPRTTLWRATGQDASARRAGRARWGGMPSSGQARETGVGSLTFRELILRCEDMS
jgi:hypothetical protein